MWTSKLLRKFYRLAFGPLREADSRDCEGIILVAGGIGGIDGAATGLAYAAAARGLSYRVECLHWSCGLGRWFRDLTDTRLHAEQAALLVDWIYTLRESHPGVPIYLAGKSGGSKLVVQALEQLPEASVEAAVLLGPALSPGYDLTGALRGLKRELIVYYSPYDAVLLNLGTRIFGTIDRVHSVASGLVGFRQPEGANAATYERLRQIRWQRSMVRDGYLGEHFTLDHPRFLERHVMPWLEPVGQVASAEQPSEGPMAPAPRA